MASASTVLCSVPKSILEPRLQGLLFLERLLASGVPVPSWKIRQILKRKMNLLEGALTLLVARLLRLNMTLGFLRDAGVDIFATDHRGNNALHVGILKGSIVELKFLVKMEQDLLNKANNLGQTALHAAASAEKFYLLRLLVEANAALDIPETILGHTALHICAERGHTKCLSILLENGADVEKRNSLDETPLHVAVRQNHVQAARRLLAAGADPHALSKSGRSPLELSVLGDRVQMITEMIRARVDLNKRYANGYTALLRAVDRQFRHGGTELTILKMLIDSGASVEVTTKHGRTPLSVAFSHGSKEAIKLLLKAGAK